MSRMNREIAIAKSLAKKWKNQDLSTVTSIACFLDFSDLTLPELALVQRHVAHKMEYKINEQSEK